jgi:polar amino acid transport system substrate-binding protein
MKRTSLARTFAAVLWFVTTCAGGTEPLDEKLSSPLPIAPIPKKKLIVGVSPAPPFNIQKSDGSWTGISVELWEQVAKELDLDYAYHETDLPGNFAGLVEGWLDVAVGPLTITGRREEVCDFTHAYFASSLAIAVPTNHLSGSDRFFANLFNWSIWRVVLRVAAGLLATMALVAVFIWLCERRANSAHFGGGGHPARGYGTALWWSAVTMTTVGYGDISPKTFRGRVIAVIWMFVSLVLVSTFTATIASVLTAERLNQIAAIRGLDDLRQLRIGTFADSSSAQFLQANHIDHRTFERKELFEELENRKIQAVLYDEPFLRYVVRTQYPDEFTVLPLNLDTQLYALALREGSSLREPINRVLLSKVHEPTWQSLLYRYLGTARD